MGNGGMVMGEWIKPCRICSRPSHSFPRPPTPTKPNPTPAILDALPCVDQGVRSSSATFCRWCWHAWECTWYNHRRQGSRTPPSRAGRASRKRLYVPKTQSLGKVWRSFGSPTPDKAVWGHSPDVPVWRDGDHQRERGWLMSQTAVPCSLKKVVARRPRGEYVLID